MSVGITPVPPRTLCARSASSGLLHWVIAPFCRSVSDYRFVIRALRQATSSIPIVIVAVNDPVEKGFVSSLAHPGGNITGFTFIDFQMVGKWLEMLKEATPALSRAKLVFNPDTPPRWWRRAAVWLRGSCSAGLTASN